jgi:hypothetical protein
MSRYLFDEDDLSKKVITLLSIINASKGNHCLLAPHEKAKQIYSIFYFEWSIIQDTLIHLAIQFRLIDDLFTKEKKIYELPYFSVGNLTTNKVINSLSFRESCNKIVHAVKFEPVIEEAFSSYSNQIILKGNKGNSEWIAELDILKFCINALAFTNLYEDDWDIKSRT